MSQSVFAVFGYYPTETPDGSYGIRKERLHDFDTREEAEKSVAYCFQYGQGINYEVRLVDRRG